MPSNELDLSAQEAEYRRLRLITLIGCGAQVLFWIFFAFYIGEHTNPRGDGVEWLAFVPATLILFALVSPRF